MSSISLNTRFHNNSIYSVQTLIAGLLFCTVSMIGCSNSDDSVTSPPQQQIKNPRDYSWTIDTLYFTPAPQAPGQTILQDLWGINDTIVYVGCHDAWGGNGALWKFNGKCWERVKLGVWEGGPLTEAYDIRAITGSSPTDIYAFGSYELSNDNPPPNYLFKVFAVHFNGTAWHEISLPQGQYIFDVNHDSPTIIYGGGSYGQLFKFDGVRWTVDTVQTPASSDIWMTIKVIGAAADSGVFIQIRQHNQKTGAQSNELAIYAKKRMTRLAYTGEDIPWGGDAFWKSKEGNIYSCGWNGVFRISGTKWSQIKVTYSYVRSIWGTNDKHIFVCEDNDISFFDGSTWSILNTGISTKYYISKLWCSANEVFVAFSDGQRTYILHGK